MIEALALIVIGGVGLYLTFRPRTKSEAELLRERYRATNPGTGDPVPNPPVVPGPATPPPPPPPPAGEGKEPWGKVPAAPDEVAEAGVTKTRARARKASTTPKKAAPKSKAKVTVAPAKARAAVKAVKAAKPKTTKKRTTTKRKGSPE
jgi:hypothetical protein